MLIVIAQQRDVIGCHFFFRGRRFVFHADKWREGWGSWRIPAFPVDEKLVGLFFFFIESSVLTHF